MALLVYGLVSLLWLTALVFLGYQLYLQYGAAWLPYPPRPINGYEPLVTVQVPIYNEGDLSLKLMERLLQLDYPRDKLQIQILDDSTDDTADLLMRWTERVRTDGWDIEYLHRTDRREYKAGALQAALPRAKGELLLLLDADFSPPLALLRSLVPWFADPRMGFVQAPWAVSNASDSLASRLAFYWVQQHFEIDQPSRSKRKSFMHFNGTAGLWRKEAIVDAGGWSGSTLAEDFDLSLRSWFGGRYLSRFDPTTPVPSLVPTSMRALKIQQARWATGSIQVLVKYWRMILRRGFPENFTLLMHASGYFFGTTIMLLALVGIFGALLAVNHRSAFFWSSEVPGYGFLAAALIQTAELAYRRGWRVSLRQFYYLTLGLGLSPWILRHLIRGFRLRGGEFVRTPKGRYRADASLQYYVVALLELILGAACLWSSLYCLMHSYWGSAYLPLIVGAGLVYVGIQSLRREAGV